MTRLLTVEPFGDFRPAITASAVRLKGQWLRRAGFQDAAEWFRRVHEAVANAK